MLTISEYLWEGFKVIQVNESDPFVPTAAFEIRMNRDQHPALNEGAKADHELFGGMPCHQSQIRLKTDDTVPVDSLDYTLDGTNFIRIDFAHAV